MVIQEIVTLYFGLPYSPSLVCLDKKKRDLSLDHNISDSILL
jgi:hypothetical protein